MWRREGVTHLYQQHGKLHAAIELALLQLQLRSLLIMQQSNMRLKRQAGSLLEAASPLFTALVAWRDWRGAKEPFGENQGTMEA